VVRLVQNVYILVRAAAPAVNVNMFAITAVITVLHAETSALLVMKYVMNAQIFA